MLGVDIINIYSTSLLDAAIVTNTANIIEWTKQNLRGASMDYLDTKRTTVYHVLGN